MVTCLFTKEPLNEKTKVEHTIPRALGGRVRSREVSSSSFNEKCGQIIDPFMVDPFKGFLNILDPMLTKEHGSGALPVKLDNSVGRYVLEPGGEISLKNQLVGKDESGKPNSITAESRVRVTRFAQSQGWSPEQFTVQDEPVTTESIANAKRLVLSVELELGFLKSGLLTFDHLLAGRPNRFTRSKPLEPLIVKIKNAVMDNNVCKSIFTEHVRGIDYGRGPEILEYREKYGDTKPSMFEHILLAVGNAGQRSVGLVWSVFGFEPHFFLLSRHWDGPDFSYLVTNGVLKGEEASGVTECSTPFSLGRETDYRSHLPGYYGEKEFRRVLSQIGSFRDDAYRKACDIVERSSDKTVKNGIKESTRLLVATPSKPGKVYLGVKERLGRLFPIDSFESSRQKLFDDIVMGVLKELPKEQEIARGDEKAEHIDWGVWIDAHRKVLDALAPEFGLPGVIFSKEFRFSREDSPGRTFGDLSDESAEVTINMQNS